MAADADLARQYVITEQVKESRELDREEAERKAREKAKEREPWQRERQRRMSRD